MSKPSLRTIFEGVIVAGVALMLMLQFSAQRDLGNLKATDTYILDRIDRIADALPGIGAQIAYEGLLDPVRTIFLVGEPVEKNNIWVTNVWLMNAENDVVTAYSVSLGNKDDDSPYHQALGRVLSTPQFAVTRIRV